ncbi:RAD55 family ATPase [Archaeoglobus neptunius]|uniref:RAD55 family ATPase n=1 Tax=Archaeoglobus neptunius TaxID=2798580 RepID=UPI001926F2B8|nr:RAD55 family ATPase [Archaeoglobus neptunius]
MKLMKTGILPFDTQLGGGIPSGSVVLILEEPGAGADVFSYHFAVEGALHGENVFYLATDDAYEEIKEYVNLYFDLDEAVWENITLFSLTSAYNRESEKDAKDYLKKTMYDPIGGLKTILSHEEFERVIINNLTYFLANYPIEDVISLIEVLSKYAKRNESVFLLLMTKGMFDSRIETTIKHYADGVIELTLREVENEVQRRLKVIKFKGILVPKAILRYELTDKGIKMESVMRVL